MPHNRIRFTRTELELINDMAAIASAQHWGEGDYAEWGKGDHASKSFDSLREKVWELISRADALPDNLSAGRTHTKE
jgi:hypothetical protein